MSEKTVLVLGGTGAMGQYLAPELLSFGYKVDAVTLDTVVSNNPNLKYITENVFEGDNLSKLLSRGYDGVVDFMTYTTKEFEAVHKKFLDNTGHYIFLSSCRVYADMPPITEKTPRLLDVSEDKEYLKTEDYSLYKAREEDILENSSYSNWTVVRPATTFSRGKFQLVTLWADTFVYRMLNKKTVVLPEGARDKQATLSWGGDVAKIIARLLFNDKAYREYYNVCSAEHNSWEDIAKIYNDVYPFDYIWVDNEEYLDILGPNLVWPRYQLYYARMFQRITDNSKALAHTGLKQSDFMLLKDGLKYEFDRSINMDWNRFANDERNVRMDAYLKNMNK